ncbi:MAG TPA: hypothetical protein VMJ32_08450 [Pirellulales bacterium]|nr:hypothetical protein [Pirellulales bacterium]
MRDFTDFSARQPGKSLLVFQAISSLQIAAKVKPPWIKNLSAEFFRRVINCCYGT